MATRADVNMSFYMRFLLIGVVAVGYGLWAVYDGFVKYPQQRIRALKYQELAQTENFESEWVEYARSQGWSLENPGEPKTQADIYFNYALAAICLPLGLWMIFRVIRARGRWIEADETTLRGSWGQQLVFDQITRLDKRKWKNKGIAKVHYEEDGRRRKFVIDDFKFRREPTGEILRTVEAAIGHDKIGGGPPEA